MSNIEDKELGHKVMGIYFRTSYAGFGVNTPEDIAFIQGNKIQVYVDKESKRNGYKDDKTKIEELGLNQLYTLRSMSVERSSSTIELDEYPGRNWNSVNFKFAKL
jgi:hypothetical protein